MNEYMDILTFPHYELRYHERMSLENRAAQFAPFDALTGYKEEINEVMNGIIAELERAFGAELRK